MASTRIAPGALIDGRYELRSRTDDGPLCEVWLAQDTRFRSREVVVRLLAAGASRDARAVARFENAADTLAALHHPGIVAVYDRGAWWGRRFMVVEPVSGVPVGSPSGLQRQGGAAPPVPPGQLAEQLLDALGAAHAAGVVHRALSSSNVVVSGLAGGGSIVKILDFGATAEATGASVPGGTAPDSLRYLAPEQLRPDLGEVGPWSDIFAAAVLLVEVIHGEGEPRKGTSWGAWCREHDAETEEHLRAVAPALPPVALAALTAALSLDPARRPAASSLREALRDAWASQPVLLPDVASMLAGLMKEPEKRAPRGSKAKSVPTAADGASVATGLRLVLEELLAGEHEFVIAKAAGRSNHFVQFALQGEGMVAEAVSNRFLEGTERLDEAAQARLVELGWTAPLKGKKAPNYHRFWKDPVPLDSVAQTLARTLAEVYKVTDPRRIKLDFGQEENVPLAGFLGQHQGRP